MLRSLDGWAKTCNARMRVLSLSAAVSSQILADTTPGPNVSKQCALFYPHTIARRCGILRFMLSSAVERSAVELPTLIGQMTFTLQKFHGAQNGWRSVSSGCASIDRETAERRLSLYRKVRGDISIFRIVECNA